MRNRAKCKLCGDVIESIARGEYVQCKCTEIGIVGGTEYYGTQARNYDNFLRLDDSDNEISVQYVDSFESFSSAKPVCRAEMIDMLDEMGKAIERLPQHAMMQPITHADHYSLILLLSSIFRSDLDCK